MAEETAGGGTTRNKTAVQLSAKEKSVKALQMRTMRFNYDRIAEECGYANRSAAYKAVQRELKRIPFEAVTELRQVELASLDDYERALAARALKGEVGATDRILRIKEQRAKLTGLYEDTVDTGVTEVVGVLTAWFGQVRKAVEAEERGTEVPGITGPDQDDPGDRGTEED